MKFRAILWSGMRTDCATALMLALWTMSPTTTCADEEMANWNAENWAEYVTVRENVQSMPGPMRRQYAFDLLPTSQVKDHPAYQAWIKVEPINRIQIVDELETKRALSLPYRQLAVDGSTLANPVVFQALRLSWLGDPRIEISNFTK